MLLVSDANIFIDLYKIDLLGKFDKLDFALATTDFVIHELRDEQRSMLEKLNIKIVSMDGDELGVFYSEFGAIGQLHISSADYSVFYTAKKYDGVVLSNDKVLRNFAINRNIKVKGIFYILDKFVELGFVSQVDMIKHLEELSRVNNRLPMHEIEKRIELLHLQ